MDPVELVRKCGGAARIGQILAAGATEYSVRAAVSRGLLLRPHPGVVAVPLAESAVITARIQGGAMSCVSAARHHRLWVLHPPEGIHVSCPRGNPAPGVVIHRAAARKYPYLPVTNLVQTLLDAVHCLPEPDALVLLQSAIGQGSTTAAFLRTKLTGNRNGRVRNLLSYTTPRADSVPEILARRILMDSGYRFESYVWIPGIGEVDFLVEGILILEVDGEHHREKRQFKKDRRRDNRAAVDGYRVLRFVYEDIVYKPQEVVRLIQAVLTGRVLPN